MSNNRILIGIFASISFFFWGMLGVSIGALLPNAMKTFSLTPLLAGMVFVIWSIGFSGGSFVANRLLKVFGAVPVLACLSGLTALLALIQFYASMSSVFYAVYLLLGLCGGAIFTASHTLFGELFVERRSSALAVLDVVFSVGNMVAPLLIVAVLNWKMNWQSFYLLAAIGFAAIACLFTLQLFVRIPTDKSEASVYPQHERQSLAALPASSLISLAVVSFLLGAIEWTQNVWFVTYALDQGLTQNIARYGLAAFTAGMIAARIFVIWFAAAAQSTSIHRAMIFIALLGETLVVFGKAAPLALVGNCLLGAGIGALFPIFLGRAMDKNPAAGAALSMLMIVSLTLGGQFASFALGALAGQFGVATAFYATIPVILLMSITYELYKHTGRQ